jgi:transposase
MSKICLHFLPPYSPNLNPIERLWKWMKERVIYNSYYEHFEDFKGAIFGFFTVLSTAVIESIFAQELRSRVRDKFSPIGAPA